MSISNHLIPISSGIFNAAFISGMQRSITFPRYPGYTEAQQQFANGFQRAFIQCCALAFSRRSYLEPAASALGRPLLTKWKWAPNAVSLIIPFAIFGLAHFSQTPAIRSIATFAHQHLGKVIAVISIVSLGVLGAYGQAFFVGITLSIVAINFVAARLVNCKGKLATIGSAINSISTVSIQAASIYRFGWFPAVCIGAGYLDRFIWSRIPSSIKIDEKEREALSTIRNKFKFDGRYSFELPELNPNGPNSIEGDLSCCLDENEGNRTLLEEEVKAADIKISAENIAEFRQSVERFRDQQLEVFRLSVDGLQPDEVAIQETALREPVRQVLECAKEGLSPKQFLNVKLKFLSMLIPTSIGLEGEPKYPLHLLAHLIHSIKDTNPESARVHLRILLKFVKDADFEWTPKTNAALFDAFLSLGNPKESLTLKEKTALLVEMEREARLETLIEDSIQSWSGDNTVGAMSYALHKSFFPKNLVRAKLGLSVSDSSQPWSFYSYFHHRKIQQVIDEFLSNYPAAYFEYVPQHSIFGGFIPKEG